MKKKYITPDAEITKFNVTSAFLDGSNPKVPDQGEDTEFDSF